MPSNRVRINTLNNQLQVGQRQCLFDRLTCTGVQPSLFQAFAPDAITTASKVQDFAWNTFVVDDFLKGNVDVLVHSEQFAAVCYHLTDPEISLVPSPFGFITHDKNYVTYVHNIVQPFCSDVNG